jgi:uncharacterized protein (DUF885 family)
MRLGIALALVSTWFVFSSALVAAEAEMNETEKLQTFFEEEWEYGLKENPIMATLFGDLRYNDQLGDSSIAAIERRQRHGVEALRQLESIDRSRLADSDKLNYDLYLENLTLRIEGHRFPWYLTPINQMGGVQQGPPNVVRSLPFRNAKHYEDYLSRLSQLPAVVDQTIERMQEGLKQRITPPKITLRAVAEQIQAQIVSKVEESPFYRPFKNFPETVPLSEQERLSAAGKEAIEQSILPAYQKLHDFWVSEYYPNTRETIGLSSLPNGEQWYAFGVKVSTTTNLLPKEIHEIGLREVKRIRAEMDKIIKGSGFEGTREEFFEFLRGDPQFYYSKPEHLLAGYRDICKRADAELPKLFGKFPRLPYGVREVPEYSAPSQTTAYYHGGSLKAGRPGWFYANTYKLETRPKWEMEALAIHEAVPGHHLQIALAQEIEGVPKFRKHGHYTAFVEGWGLYSESLGEEMGFYNDPYSKFGQLTYEMWRAIRLVVDTGMHAFGWDRQKAIDYFKSNAGRHEHDITVEVDRYIVWPGQALAYKIGELKIKELRKFATKELGDRFDIRGFHDTVLGSGAVPLSILEQNVKNYVAAEIKKMTQGN